MSEHRRKRDVRHADCLKGIAERRDKDCFSELFAYCAPRVKAWLINQGWADEHRAEDLAQDCMLSVWHKAHHYDPEQSAPTTWIFTIARNMAFDRIRREKHPSQLVGVYRADLIDPPSPEDIAITADRDAKLAEAYRRLPDEQAAVVEQVYCDLNSHTETSRNLGIPVGTVKSRLRLAMEKLRAIMICLGWIS